MPRRTRAVPDSPAVQELHAAVDNLQQAEQRLQKAIVEAAREAAVKGSKLTYTAIGRIAGYTREYGARQAAGAGIHQDRANTKIQDHDPAAGT